MTCDQYRESVSARLDGEEPGLPDSAIDTHLLGCAGCAAWCAAAQRVTRLARVAPAEPVPDLSAAVLAAARPLRRIQPGELLVRAGLALLAVAQVLLAWPSLAGRDALTHSLHTAHETGSWNAALAVAVGWIAVRPRHAAGLLPLLAALAAVLTVASVADLRAGNVDSTRVSTHVLVWCALALVAALIWVRREPRPSLGGRGGGVRPADPVEDLARFAEPADPPGRAVRTPATGRAGAAA
jgi:predicted anti-sigma-YlaC factor YlaD